MEIRIKANNFDGFTWVLRNRHTGEVIGSGTAETHENAARMAGAEKRWHEEYPNRITHNSDANL